MLCLAEDQVLVAVSQPRALLHTLAELNEHEKKGTFPKSWREMVFVQLSEPLKATWIENQGRRKTLT